MTTLPNLETLAEPAIGTELVYVWHPVAGSGKRPISHFTKFFLGNSTATPIGFYGVTPVPQAGEAAQAAISLTIGAAVVGTAATQTTPYGYATQAQADALVARVNQLRTDMTAAFGLLLAIRAALVAVGLIKGSA
ncbi:hypothetical protein [Bosea sp. BK604]|uniref:hypothetical protein n=1 Tax=Bosea sp. BK604 TaxID=2512180 RepID=UPI00104868DA|nr:hypothetical protein [Bosea sp. BK604]TCR64704.1 hypothetical protein EV560_106170 [Bosea sp. BK604]